MVTTRPAAPSYIIKRPRLTKLLDESEARIILLCAPAGYGKTTLAREWVEAQDKPVAWYAGGVETPDPMGLAIGLASCLRSVGVHAVEDDLVAAGASTTARPEVLARCLATAAEGNWEGLLVVDDYHHAIGSPDAEALLETFIVESTARVILTSRIRPTWLTSRLEIYGAALVVSADQLAFTDEEALAVLPSKQRLAQEDFLTTVGGWPAIIGLVALRGSTPFTTSRGTVPTELFAYFSEDLFASVPSDVRRTLFLLALGGDRRRGLLAQVVGPVLDTHLALAADHGLITQGGSDSLDIHPLMRAFLVAKLQETDEAEAEDLVQEVVVPLAEAGQWDDCLETLTAFQIPHLIEEFFQPAVNDLLAKGRIVTVRRWIDLARSARWESPTLLIAEAEVALREGKDAKAQTLAEQAGRLFKVGDLAAHAHILAARAAHLRGDKDASKRLSIQARNLTEDATTRANALWIAFHQAVEADDPAARSLLADLEGIDDQSATHALRKANGRAVMSLEFAGRVNEALRAVTLAHELLPHVQDPLLRTNFLNFAVSCAGYGAEYDRAIKYGFELESDARANGLDFVIHHALLGRAAAYIGLRRLSAAVRLLNDVESSGTELPTYIQLQTILKRACVRVACGDLQTAAILLSAPPPPDVPATASGEWFGAKAIILAAQGNVSEARHAIDEAKAASAGIDATHFGVLADAILGLSKDADAASSDALRATQRILKLGNRASIVFAARAFPPLARSVVAGSERLAPELSRLFATSRDFDIGRAAGLQFPRELRRSDRLSSRESEVYELLVQGRTNKEIASALFISESTTKVHVRHIFEKLGVHTRAEAVAARADKAARAD